MQSAASIVMAAVLVAGLVGGVPAGASEPLDEVSALTAAASSTLVDDINGLQGGTRAEASSNVTCSILPHVAVAAGLGAEPAEIHASHVVQCVGGDLGAQFGIDSEISLESMDPQGQPMVWEQEEGMIHVRYFPTVQAGIERHEVNWTFPMEHGLHYRARFSVGANGDLKQERYMLLPRLPFSADPSNVACTIVPASTVTPIGVGLAPHYAVGVAQCSSFDVDREYDLEMVIRVESKPGWADDWQAKGENRCSVTMQGTATLTCAAQRPSELEGVQEERVTISVYVDGDLKQEWSGPIPPEG